MPYYLNVKDNEIISYSELPVEECENITVSKLVFDDFSENRSKYYVQNGELKAKTAAQMLQEAEQEEKKRIAKMSMTKYDFFKYVCQPYGITYKQLVAAANSTDEMAAAWNLCSAVYRGDEVLCANITKFIPALTEHKLDEIFEQYGTESE